MGIRQDRIDEMTQRELNAIIRTVKDYRLEGSLVNITASRVTKDLSVAKVYFAVLSPKGGSATPEQIKKVTQGLNSASPYIRGELSKRLNLRVTPKLFFEFDNSVDNAFKIEEALKKIENESKSKENDDE